MKFQVLFSLKYNDNISRLLSAAVMAGTLRVNYKYLPVYYITSGIYHDCYAPTYSKNSGRALSVTPVRPVRLSVRPSVCPSVRPYVPLSCPGHNSKTLWNIFMKLHRCIHHNKTMCHEQGRQLLHKVGRSKPPLVLTSGFNRL